MPTIFFYGPELEKDKRKPGIEEAAFVVYLRSTDPGSVGVGGVLLEDRK